jgi:hypothetical protein
MQAAGTSINGEKKQRDVGTSGPLEKATGGDMLGAHGDATSGGTSGGPIALEGGRTLGRWSCPPREWRGQARCAQSGAALSHGGRGQADAGRGQGAAFLGHGRRVQGAAALGHGVVRRGGGRAWGAGAGGR